MPGGGYAYILEDLVVEFTQDFPIDRVLLKRIGVLVEIEGRKPFAYIWHDRTLARSAPVMPEKVRCVLFATN